MLGCTCLANLLNSSLCRGHCGSHLLPPPGCPSLLAALVACTAFLFLLTALASWVAHLGQKVFVDKQCGADDHCHIYISGAAGEKLHRPATTSRLGWLCQCSARPPQSPSSGTNISSRGSAGPVNCLLLANPFLRCSQVPMCFLPMLQQHQHLIRGCKSSGRVCICNSPD